MTIGERIRKIRTERGLTQKKLGELCGMNEVQIRQYELGKANPKIETIEKIANALLCSVDELRGMHSILDLTILPLDKLIAKYMLTSEISQKQLADKTGISIDKLQKIEQGKLFSKTKPSWQHGILSFAELKKIANALNIPTSELTMSILDTPNAFDIPNKFESDAEIFSYLAERNKINSPKSNKNLEKEIALFDLQYLFDKLNTNGKKEILKRLEELTQLKQYTEK